MDPSPENRPIALIAGELASMHNRLDIGFENPIRCALTNTLPGTVAAGLTLSSTLPALFTMDMAFSRPYMPLFVSSLLISRKLEPLDSDRHM
jgi:hypothetical protein